MEAENTQSAEPGKVGRLLRHHRTSHGQSIEDVCQLLRIRKIYIEAIENCDYSALPGAPYGLGFVKAYAEHLGLDGSEIVRRYKEESNTPEMRRELSFPKPVQESRVPGGGVLLVAVLLGLGAYGGWYYMSSQGKTFADLVDPLPDRLEGLSNTTEKTNNAEVVVAPRSIETAADARAAEAPADAPATVIVPEGETSVDVTEQPTVAEETPAEIAEEPEAGVDPDEVAEAPAEITVTPEVEAVPEPAPQASAPAEIAAVPAAPEVGAAGGARVFGALNTDSRVTISAVETSWVRIRENDGNILLTRMLSPGDTYRVPNRDGLKLEVGNAGALALNVDGQDGISVGDYGAVISDFSLNADDILATASGTAPAAQ
ncbi:helix-turn-helix domain-containing protein [Thalassospira sp.]|uniref:helix-turn-helix domain-containing protein n=1 Tax=Thalassospira sp. TaxID=1912094 RepID=UPI0027355E0A|nr:helix-turn-helix domain-containing protein [Thalassospira sp.]MDP2698409.1 DUF4115 domain-containing protein [Thalassospira sp.]